MVKQSLRSLTQVSPDTPRSGAAAEDMAGAMTRVQDYLDAMQHRYVSEDAWWQGFARLFMDIDRQLHRPIALEIAVDQLLARQGSTSWSVQRSRMAL